MTIPKFRAYIKETKLIHEVLNINFYRKDVEIFVGKECESYLFDEIELLQFTNKIDIDGKEIYTGDVCSFKVYNYYEGWSDQIGMVKFVDAAYSIRYPDSKYNGKHWIKISKHNIKHKSIKIIGNIYTFKNKIEEKDNE